MSSAADETITPNPTMETAVDCEANEVSTGGTQELALAFPTGSDLVVPKKNSDWSGDRRNSIKAEMASKKMEDRFPLQEDVYAFITVAPVFSFPFAFSCAIIFLKFLVYGILASDISVDDFDIERVPTTVCKFFLIPVAIAMQEDLIDAYWFFANVIYCESLMTHESLAATKGKLYFSYSLRTLDGLFGLAINFTIMLSTPTTLATFLNFAALQFLQSIDDVFYELACLGFFGDNMEHMSMVCKNVSLKRRHGQDNTVAYKYFRISHLDTILFIATFIACFISYIVVTFRSYQTIGDSIFITEAPTMSPTALNETLNFTNPQA